MLNNWEYIEIAREVIDNTPKVKDWEDLSKNGYIEAVSTGNVDRYWRSIFKLFYNEWESGG